MRHSSRSRTSFLEPVLGLLAWLGIVAWFADSFHIQFALASGLSVLVFAALVFGTTVRSSVVRFLQRHRRCVHGVRAGERGSCLSCQAEVQRADRERREAEAKRQRQRELQAAASQLQDEERRRLSAAWLSNAEPYLSMNPQEFENAVAELFRTLGYEVEQTPFSNDGGKDAIATKDGKKFLIECKRYGADKSIGRRDLQILVAAMQDEKADGGFFINTGVFAGTAESYAAKYRIVLYDRVRLPSLINKAYGSAVDFSAVRVMCRECGCIINVAIGTEPTAGTCANGHEVQNNIKTADLRMSSAAQKPCCSACGAPMRIVSGRRGKFWGCSRYPHCRITKRIARPSYRY